MQRVIVVTDSVATVPEAFCRDLGILVVPMSIELDGVVYQDGFDIESDDFYARMALAASSGAGPRTSQPSPGAWLERFEAAARTGATDILCLTLSSELSGTYASAVQAAAIFADDAPRGTSRPAVRVLDTRLATISQGWVVIEAARLARAGGTAEDVAARASQAMAGANMLVAVDTMDYLARGGHVPGLVAAFTETLGLKPLIRFKHGHVAPAGLATSVDQAMDTMLRHVERRLSRAAASGSRAPTGGPACRRPVLRIGVMHAGVPDRAARLETMLRARLDPDELLVTGFTPVMGAHTGPGLFGVGYLVE